MLGWARNELDYCIRRFIGWRRSGCRLPAEPKDGLFAPDVQPEAARLVTRYGLSWWEGASGRKDFAGSLDYLFMLERAFTAAGVVLPDRVTALDAGCGDWFYVQALYGLLRFWDAPSAGREVALEGVEVDAYQLYAGLYSRLDWADAYAGGLNGVIYTPGDVRNCRQPVDVAFLLFPFLFGPDLRRGGLPRRYLRPAELLGQVHGLVREGGWMAIANVSPREYEAQHELLRAAGIAPVWSGPYRSVFGSHREPRSITLVQKWNR